MAARALQSSNPETTAWQAVLVCTQIWARSSVKDWMKACSPVSQGWRLNEGLLSCFSGEQMSFWDRTEKAEHWSNHWDQGQGEWGSEQSGLVGGVSVMEGGGMRWTSKPFQPRPFMILWWPFLWNKAVRELGSTTPGYSRSRGASQVSTHTSDHGYTPTVVQAQA